MSRFIASIVALLLTSLSDAKAWPDQPVKMVVPFAAGGTTDVMARIVAERVAALLGRPVIIENVPGAGGNSAAARQCSKTFWRATYSSPLIPFRA
jgi:tripartite-type tricarboxylate transporter receptor subunit TctC